MSSQPSIASNEAITQPLWLAHVLGRALPPEGTTFRIGHASFLMRKGIPRAKAVLTESQSQTRDSFDFIWRGADRFTSAASFGRLIDGIFAQGVLHHTDSTEREIRALPDKLTPGDEFFSTSTDGRARSVNSLMTTCEPSFNR